MTLPASSPHHDAARGRGRSSPEPVSGNGLKPHLAEPWPPGISRAANMRISDVLGTLRTEFPAITHSKLRFLEEQGLVEPVRTPSGYRQYSLADVERLRFVLAEQRDRYLPLRVIKEKLSELDAGSGDDVVPAPRLVDDAETGAGPHSTSRLTVQTLADEAGVDVSLVEEMVSAGVIRANSRGYFDIWTKQIVTLVSGLGAHGIEPRHLRPTRAAVDRDLALVNQVIAPLRNQQTLSARARAGSMGAELGETLAQLHIAMLRQGISDLTL